jgi:CubicO group peptidase (beta-lactamase class C family)
MGRTRRAAAIDDLLRARIAAGDFPGASYLVAEDGRILAEGALGGAVVDPEPIPAALSTLYDLASLTKPLATGVLALLLESSGALRIEDTLARHLPRWPAEDARAGITLGDLLAHRSGLPAWAPLYLHARDRDGRIDWIARAPGARAPRHDVVYSDLGYILLGFALERAGGAPIERLFAERVARPVGASPLLFRPPASLKRRIAATEAGNAREAELAGEAGRRYNGWRTGVIWGEVHDHNAHSLGGAAGHAGLFGTARAVLALASELLGGGRGLLPDEQRARLRVNLTPGMSEDRSVGFQLASTAGSAAGRSLSAASFGHTGFTGTSLFIDPEARRVYILLTNRVHPRFRPVEMNAIRRQFHDLAAGI